MYFIIYKKSEMKMSLAFIVQGQCTIMTVLNQVRPKREFLFLMKSYVLLRRKINKDQCGNQELSVSLVIFCSSLKTAQVTVLVFKFFF